MVSIIIPTYNRESTIKRAIESVLNQTYKDIELIIVDDCSTDNTEDVVKSIEDSRLKYFKLEKNSGACVARNYGVAIANGEYIAFQDSDDEWYSNKLEEQLNNMKNNNSDADFCMYKKISDNSETICPINIALNRMNKYGIEKALSYGNFIGTPLLIAKKSIFEKLKFDENLPRFQDWDFVIKLSHYYKISFTNKILANTYIQGDSITKNNEKLLKAVEVMSKNEYYYKDILMSSLYSLAAKNSSKNIKRKYYKKALSYHFDFKTLIKYIINY